MRIKDVRTTLLELPWVDPPRFSLDYDLPRRLVVVDVEMDNGVTGMGYLQPLGGGLRTLEACIHEVFKPLLLGRDATHVEGLWQRMWQATYSQGRAGHTLMALSALDVALWDALGRHAGLPLFRLWGATDTELPCYGSGCWRGLGGDGMIEKAQRFVAQGFGAIKMQAGHLYPWRQDVAHVRDMRHALGDDVEIMIDVNMGWTADQAINAGRHFEAYDVYWLEEPVPAHDYAGYRRIARTLDLRVVGGENHFTRFELRPFFEEPCLPILQPDVMRGGLTELRKIATLADTWGILLAPHLFSELMVQVMASIPNPHMVEYMGWLDDLFEDPPLPESGVIRPTERPGHGLVFRPEVLRDHVYKGA